MITLTNGAQVPENAVQLRTTAPMDGYYVTQPLQLVQYDETLPVAAVQLTYQNQPYIPSSGAELNVRMGKPDGTTVYNPCLGVDSSGVVYFIFTLQMTIVAGTGTLTVEVTDSGVKNSAQIIVNVAPNPVPEGAIASTDEFLTLQQILADAERWGQIVQANAANIQEVVDNLTDIQNAAENAQAAAASAEAAQQAAQEALGFRTFFSAVTPDSNGNLDPSRPMTVGPAASVEIESAGDRIQSVTALGFTTQAGTGDPSPTNVRQLTNGGLRMVKVLLDGSSGKEGAGSTDAVFVLSISISVKAKNGQTSPTAVFGSFRNVYGKRDVGYAFVFASGAGVDLHFPKPQISSAAEAKAYLQKNPVPLWYEPADESQATGLYAPIILQGGEYRATCLPLTAPLCEGDSVVSWARSGCDQQLTLDGSQLPTSVATLNTVYKIAFTLATPAVSGPQYSESFFAETDFSLNAEHFYASTNLYVFVDKAKLAGDTKENAQQYFAAHPLTVWYRSTNYTEAADIPVSLETHQRAVLVLDGTEIVGSAGVVDETGFYLFFSNLTSNATSDYANDAICDHFKNANTQLGTGYTSDKLNSFCVNNSQNGLRFVMSHETIGTTPQSNASECKSAVSVYLAAQYAAGTPVTIVYRLATPITYAHPAVVLEAATGEQLTYTVTGQSGGTVSVAIKPFQDGGHAKTADNAQQLGGLTLPALQNLLVPVGYIFSWAPVDNGPDLSTPAAVAEYFGFGTWEAYGAGQVLVGLDAGQTEFATPGKTGGEKTHTLTVPELASHRHAYAVDTSVTYTGTPGYDMFKVADSGSSNTGETGGNQPHNNLQPYVVVYRWQRIA